MRITVAEFDMTLDKLVWRALGRPEAGLVEAALDLNRGIAGAGIVLPVGTLVTLPEPAPPAPRRVSSVRLWG